MLFGLCNYHHCLHFDDGRIKARARGSEAPPTQSPRERVPPSSPPIRPPSSPPTSPSTPQWGVLILPLLLLLLLVKLITSKITILSIIFKLRRLPYLPSLRVTLPGELDPSQTPLRTRFSSSSQRSWNPHHQSPQSNSRFGVFDEVQLAVPGKSAPSRTQVNVDRYSWGKKNKPIIYKNSLTIKRSFLFP